MYGRLLHYPAGKHAPGTMRKIVDGDTHKPLGEIPEAAYTYNVVGNINEHQLAITETTFAAAKNCGRRILWAVSTMCRSWRSDCNVPRPLAKPFAS